MTKIADDYTEIMDQIKQTIETYETKQDIVMYLDAIKTSVAFTIKITKTVMKGRK